MVGQGPRGVASGAQAAGQARSKREERWLGLAGGAGARNTAARSHSFRRLPPAACLPPTCSTLSSALNCSVLFFCSTTNRGEGHTGQEASEVSRPCGRAGVATPLLAIRPERTPARRPPRAHPSPLPLRLTPRAPPVACPREPHTAPPPPTTLHRQTLCLLACVSWKDRMTTTGCRFCVKKRSLIWALTSVSPATCQDGWG